MDNKIRFECMYCPKTFDQLKLLIGHYNLNHAPEGQYILLPPNKLKGGDAIVEAEEPHSLE